MKDPNKMRFPAVTEDQRMTEKSVDECNAYSDGWNDRQAKSDPRPPLDPALKKMYNLGYNDADETETHG
jgi:hypothetical protein